MTKEFEIAILKNGKKPEIAVVSTNRELADIVYKKTGKFYRTRLHDFEDLQQQPVANVFAAIASNNNANAFANDWDYRISVSSVNDIMLETGLSEVEILMQITTICSNTNMSASNLLDELFDMMELTGDCYDAVMEYLLTVSNEEEACYEAYMNFKEV